MTEPFSTSEHLRRAAQLLIDKGWCQGDGHRPSTGQYCTLGAIAATAVTGPDRSSAAAALRAFLFVETGHHLSIVDWNDKPGRTADEVIGTLQSCALYYAIAEQEIDHG
jgi:hypothetical protein